MNTTSNPPNDDMPDEIDFSGGVRGKFYRPGAKLNLRYTSMPMCKRI